MTPALTDRLECGGLRRVGESSDEFRKRVAAVITRFLAQNSRPIPTQVELARFADQLLQLVAERGLPPPLPPGDCGVPGGMSEQECAPLVGRVMEGLSEPVLADAARQLVKACFYPEFTVCRDAFREVTRDG